MDGKAARALLFFLLPALLAQMPDWKYFRDRQGNTYFFDQAGKIHISDAVEYRYFQVGIGLAQALGPQYGITHSARPPPG